MIWLCGCLCVSLIVCVSVWLDFSVGRMFLVCVSRWKVCSVFLLVMLR